MHLVGILPDLYKGENLLFLFAFLETNPFYTLPHNRGRYYGIILVVRVSICTSVNPHVRIFFFWPITVEIWCGIANRQISSIFDGEPLETCPYFCFWTKT